MKNILLVCLLGVSCYCGAQTGRKPYASVRYPQAFAQKTWLIGLQGGYSRGLLLQHNMTIQPYASYFITNKLSIGLSGTLNREWYDERIQNNFVSVGPLVRFQLTRARLSPFLVASYQFGRSTFSGNSSRSIHSGLFGAGLSIGIVPSLRIDAALNWQDKVGSSGSALRFDNGFFQPQFGVNYSFGGNHSSTN